MSVWTIFCPKCNHRLRVPEDSGGRPARCPACKTVFRIPHEGEMIDETIVSWLDLDRLNAEDELEEALEAQADAQRKAEAPADADGPEEPLSEEEQLIRAIHAEAENGPQPDDDNGDVDQISLEQIMQEAEPETDGHGSFVSFQMDEDDVEMPREWGKPEPGKKAVTKKEAPRTAARQQDRSGQASGSSAEGSTFMGALPGEESQSLSSDKPQRSRSQREQPEENDADRYKLHIVDVGSFGVRFGFDARLINIPSFRASMPFRCMVTGQTDPAKLIAKPLVWIDKNTGKFVDPGELETRYERQVKSGQSTREITQSMRTIDELPPPFNQPIPYYVVKEHIGKFSIHSEAFATPYGLRCETVIPFSSYALEWLGRVNGVIGDDYAQLENEVLRFQAKAWRAIPVQVRQRLGVWFEFHAKEQFLGYFNDSDFAKADAGLAGLVITDKRLVYCKYHSHGDIPLDQPGTLIAERDGSFFNLKYRHNRTLRKLVRLRNADVKTLQVILPRVSSKIDLQVPQNPPPSNAAG